MEERGLQSTAMRTVRAADLSIGEITALSNTIYADYFVPIKWRETDMERHIAAGSIDLRESLAWVDDEGAVGASLLGRRGRRAWIGGFGVIPRARGKGLAQKFFLEHIARLRTLPIDTVTVEVVEQRWATKTYELAGFTLHRRLVALSAKEVRADDHAECDVIDPKNYTRVAREIAHVFPPVWLREPAAIDVQLRDTHSAACHAGRRMTGAAIWREEGDLCRVLDIIAEDEPSARALFRKMAGNTKRIRITQEPNDSAVHRGAVSCGFASLIGQSEMLLKLR